MLLQSCDKICKCILEIATCKTGVRQVPAGQQKHKTHIHSLHDHTAYCNSSSFCAVLAEMLNVGCSEEMWGKLDLKPDAQINANACQALAG